MALRELPEEREVGRTWFSHARFGLFVHWGLYSLLGRGEWVRNRERIAPAQYVALADEFRAEGYNPWEWAQVARRAGMRYAVLTTKHHDGFCLWNSRTCAFNSANAACRRDLVGEFLDAFRAAGLKVGLYYSLGDWHNPDWAAAVHGDEPARLRFVQYTASLIEELTTDYGKLDVFWYDLPQGLTAEQWTSRELNAGIRRRQPGILINNRSMLPEDFSISERSLESAVPGRMWEAAITLNESWAYVAGDRDYKSPRDVARALARVSNGGGNLLLNVGPEGSGRWSERAEEILREVGAWLDRNGEAVYGTDGGGLPFNLWGSSTVRGNVMYLFLERYFGTEVTVGGLVPNVVRADVLGTGQRLDFRRFETQTVISGLPATPPDPLVTVLRLELDGPPDQDISRVIAGADIMASFPD